MKRSRKLKKIDVTPDRATNNVFSFLNSLGMPGLRFCESDPKVRTVLLGKGFNKTPDLICGPDDLNEAPLEGFFFIEVNEPSGDLLFKEAASRKLGTNVAQNFRTLLGDEDKFEWGLEQLPIDHHADYLSVLNNKLCKYSFLRSQTCNTGLVHFFDLGELTKERFENQDKFFAMLDYLHFYTRLECKSGKKVLVEAGKYLLKELTAEEPKRPCLIFVKRDSQEPILFLMVHVITHRKGIRFDFGIIMVNTNINENNQAKYPIHTWIVQLISNSQSVSIDRECDGTIKISVQRDKLPFA